MRLNHLNDLTRRPGASRAGRGYPMEETVATLAVTATSALAHREDGAHPTAPGQGDDFAKVLATFACGLSAGRPSGARRSPPRRRTSSTRSPAPPPARARPPSAEARELALEWGGAPQATILGVRRQGSRASRGLGQRHDGARPRLRRHARRRRPARGRLGRPRRARRGRAARRRGARRRLHRGRRRGSRNDLPARRRDAHRHHRKRLHLHAAVRPLRRDRRRRPRAGPRRRADGQRDRHRVLAGRRQPPGDARRRADQAHAAGIRRAGRARLACSSRSAACAARRRRSKASTDSCACTCTTAATATRCAPASASATNSRS